MSATHPAGDDVFLFVHVPKTGGTTILDGMAQLFGPENVHVQNEVGSRAFLADFGAKLDRGARVFSGHMRLSRLAAIRTAHPDRRIRLVVASRDVPAHFISAVLHGRNFLQASERRRLSPADLLATYDPGDLFDASCVNLVSRYLSGRLRGPVTEADVESALANLSQVDFAFDCDRLARSFRQFVTRYDLRQAVYLRVLNSNHASRRLAEDRSLLPVATLEQVLAPDFQLRGALLERFGDLPESPASLLQVRSEDGAPIYLAEVIRRVPGGNSVTAGPDHFKFYGNDILLHPPSGGCSRLETGALVDCVPSDHFRCELALGPMAASSVRFTVELSWADSRIYFETEVRPGQCQPFGTRLWGVPGKLALTFTTSVPIGQSNEYAWAFIRSPELWSASRP